jgi:hypothetical protein
VSFYLPRLLAFAIGLIAFLIGLRLQKQERKRRELRKQQMVNLVSSVVGLHSATQAMRTRENPHQGLGRVEGQQAQSPFTH